MALQGSALSLLAIVLVLTSAFMHAGWNLLSRRQMRPGLFLYRLLIVVSLVGLAPVAISEGVTRSLPPAAWLYVIASGVCCGVYYYGLSRAYESSDFTVAYPVVRAVPVLLLAVGDVLLGRHPTAAGWAGLVLVTAGCLLAPLRSFADFAAARYWNGSSMWIVLAALGTVGYSILDKLAAEVVRQGPGTAARYGYIYFVVSGLTLAAILHGFDRRQLQGAGVGWGWPAAGAVLNFGGYWLVLWAYQMTRRVSYVIALRQFSIVIGVVLAFAIFREQGRLVRLTGTSLIVTGLTLIVVWGG
jgi:drug/metabolite transporter (DMT)-like permease